MPNVNGAEGDGNTYPTLRAVAALMEDRISVSAALSELVDNAMGEVRGNARRVVIFYHHRKRELAILDDGRGIARLRDLFQLGSALNAGPRDPGWWGFGGTKALMQLGRPIDVFSLREGRVASIRVDWQAQIDRNEWPVIPTIWTAPTVATCPTELLDQGHGTLIRMRLRPGIVVKEENVRRDLAKTYGPGLRRDRRIIWQNAGPQAVALELTDPIDRIEHPIAVGIEFEHEGIRLGAQGTVGYSPTVSIADSRIGIGFVFRRLFLTTKPFKTYKGIGITGAIDLEPGWQPFLTAMKDGINDARAEKRLMEEIHQQILPLLRQVQEQDQAMLFADLGNFLEGIVDTPDGLTSDPAGEAEMPGRARGGEGESAPNSRPGPLPTFDQPMTPARSNRRRRGIEIAASTDDHLKGCLCRIEIRSEGGIIAFVNTEHRWVANALAQNPPHRDSLAFCIAAQMAPVVVEKFSAGLLKRASPAQIQRYHSLDPLTDRGERQDLATRILVDHWLASTGGA